MNRSCIGIVIEFLFLNFFPGGRSIGDLGSARTRGGDYLCYEERRLLSTRQNMYVPVAYLTP